MKWLLGFLVILSSSAIARAAERYYAYEDGISFKIVRYSRGGTKIQFTDADGVLNKFKFKVPPTRAIRRIEVGSETYVVRYDDDGEVRNVVQKSSRRRRGLEAQEDEEAAEEEGEVFFVSQSKRRLDSCGTGSSSCYPVCTALCPEDEREVRTVCDLLELDWAPFSDKALKSIESVCDMIEDSCPGEDDFNDCEDFCQCTVWADDDSRR